MTELTHTSKPALVGVERIQRGPLREQVQAQIRNLILTNSLRPGQPLIIDQVAKNLGVSHTPVREALAMLQYDGLVRMRPYGHPRVAEIEISDIHEVCEMRIVLEGWAIRKATLTLPDRALDEMEGILDRARQDAEGSRFDSHLASDLAIHGMILRSSENKLFNRLAQVVSDRSIRIRSLAESIAPAEKVFQIISEHLVLLEALRSRDPELARASLIAHLEAGMVRTLGTLEEIRANDV